MLMKTGILYFTTCFHGFGILRHVDPFVRMLHILFYKDITFKKNKFNTKSDQNIHQDALNCTFFQNFLAG